ncbi:hypothetical protein BDW62DRAFT_182952 [Aspergillus aurantiobrunneus]
MQLIFWCCCVGSTTAIDSDKLGPGTLSLGVGSLSLVPLDRDTPTLLLPGIHACRKIPYATSPMCEPKGCWDAEKMLIKTACGVVLKPRIQSIKNTSGVIGGHSVIYEMARSKPNSGRPECHSRLGRSRFHKNACVASSGHFIGRMAQAARSL